jgi:hypothetical protein
MLLRVEAITGHYTVPGPMSSGAGGLVPTFPIAPPSTIRGFLCILAGLNPATHPDLEFEYGYTRQPAGRGTLLRQAHVAASKNPEVLGELIRPVYFDTFFDVRVWIRIKDPTLAATIRARLADGWGGAPLYLGESYDLVSAVYEADTEGDEGDQPTKVVPGQQVALIWKSGYGWGNHTAQYRAYDLVPVLVASAATP